MLRIRLRRVGKKHHPFYRVVVANQQAKRDGAFLETLGSYDPHTTPPSCVLNEESARQWLGKGAQPSEAAEKILRRAGIIESKGGTAVAEPEAPSKRKKGAAAGSKAATGVVSPVTNEPAGVSVPAAVAETRAEVAESAAETAVEAPDPEIPSDEVPAVTEDIDG
jgi:small subunit ribosomal protein S16